MGTITHEYIILLNAIWLLVLRGYIKTFLSPMKPQNCFCFRLPRLSFNLDLRAGTLPNSRHRPSPVLTRLPFLHARSLNIVLCHCEASTWRVQHRGQLAIWEVHGSFGGFRRSTDWFMEHGCMPCSMMSASQRDVHFIPWHNDANEQYLRSQGYVLLYTYKWLKVKVNKNIVSSCWITRERLNGWRFYFILTT
jgi:hypothetical protein